MSVPSGDSGAVDRQVGRSAFGSDAKGYDSARSGYPPELFRLLAERVVAAPRILEIGAGTGLASEGLLGLSPSHLAIVEPDPRLCAFLEARFAGTSATVICSPFPENEVSGQFDLIACAAAFHWMEPSAALARIKSLLAPGGTWAMWWNSYFGHGLENPLAERLSQIIAEEDVALPPSYIDGRHYGFDTIRHFADLREAGFDRVEHFVFQRCQTYTARQARNLCATFSFVRILPDDRRNRFLDKVTTMVTSEFCGETRGLVATSLYASSAADQSDLRSTVKHG